MPIAHRSLQLAVTFLLSALLLTGCSSSEVNNALGIQDPNAPIPIEGDGGIGDGAGPLPGAPDEPADPNAPIVTPTIIIDGDRASVSAVCRQNVEPFAYELEASFAFAGSEEPITLTVEPAGETALLALVTPSDSYVSGAGDVRVTPGGGGINVQGGVASEAGDSYFLDVTFQAEGNLTCPSP